MATTVPVGDAAQLHPFEVNLPAAGYHHGGREGPMNMGRNEVDAAAHAWPGGRTEVADAAGSRAIVAQARLRVPRPSSLVHRSRLVDKLLTRPAVALVCAPAGSGKTTLVADWAVQRASAGDPVAWLSIEETDDRPYEFWSAVIEALTLAARPETRARLTRLSPPRQQFEPRFIEALRATLDDLPQATWLVLDDVQRLRNPDVRKGLDVLLAGARQSLCVVLVSRDRPQLALPRLAVAGQLVEITATDLAFTPSEAAAMFGLLGIAAPPGQVAELVSSTEGWAAGLRLAASASHQDDGGSATSLGDLTGDQSAVSDYLFSEVLRHLPEDVQDFLVHTCVPARLTVELAAQLADRADAGEVLERLCRANVLVTKAGQPPSYRYHSLLRSYLVSELSRRDVRAPARQHADAAAWFAANGEPTTAIEHAVRSGEPGLTRDLLADCGLRLIMTGQGDSVRDAAGLPTPESGEDPDVAVIASLASLDVGDLATADEWLAIVDKHDWPGDVRQASLRASAVTQRALLGGDVAGVLDQTRMLELPLVGDADTDLMLLAYRGPARMRSGDYPGAIADLEHALVLARAKSYDRFVLAALSQLSGMAGSLCQFQVSSDWAHDAIEFAGPRGWADSPRLAYAYLLASWTAFQTGDASAQSQFSELGVHALDGVNNVEVEVGVRSMHALAQFEAGTGRDRIRAAERFHQIWQTSAIDELSPALISLATPQEVRLLLAVGRHQWALDAVERIERLLPDSSESRTVRAQLLAGRGRTREAGAVLSPVLEGRTVTHVPTTTVLARLLGASLHARRGADIPAFEELSAALAWAAPNNYRRAFIDAWTDIEPVVLGNRGRFAAEEEFVAGLVQDLHRTDTTEPPYAGALSPRELQVLTDLPTRMTIDEIAHSRGLSPNTVKTHLRGVYLKLGVNTRQAAVRRALDLGLL